MALFQQPQMDLLEEPTMDREASWWLIGWFVVLIALTVAFRLNDPTGWLGCDDAVYYAAAEQVLNGKAMTELPLHHSRLAVIIPIAVSISCFGENPFAIALPSLLASVGCVIMVVLLGKKIWGWWEGLLAGTVVAFLPFYHVLSTAAFPAVHACLWSVLALLLLINGLITRQFSRHVMLLLFSGLAVGVATSTNFVALGVIVPIVFAILRVPDFLRRDRMVALALITGGGLIFAVGIGLYFLALAGDFMYPFTSAGSASDIPYFGEGSVYGVQTLRELLSNRLSFLFTPSVSGWGIIGILFWPVTLLALFEGRTGRMLSLWAIAVYLLAVFVPAGGRQPYQSAATFNGHYLLPAVLPFALCLGWVVKRSICASVSPNWLMRVWPGAVALILAASFYNPRELNGFKQRDTSRLAQAIQQVIEKTDWDDHRPIFMPASLYIRYRVLFPEPLRDRLHVAVDPSGDTWWENAAADISERNLPLPPPSDAYLLVTPKQLFGKGEPFDYGVLLPQNRLLHWRLLRPQLRIVRLTSGEIIPQQSATDEVKPILWLLPDSAMERKRKLRDQRTEIHPDKPVDRRG